MKKSIKWLALVSLLLIVVMSFALISCGGNDTDTDTDSNSTPTSFTVIFKQADGTEEKVTVNAGCTAIAPSLKPVDGYTVMWENVDLTNVSADITVNAVKTAIEYNITYETDGGENNSNNPAKYTIETSTITLDKPSKTGYKFLGWYSDEEHTTAVTEIPLGSKGNVTLYASWDLIQYEITYETGIGTNNIGNPSKYTLSNNDLVLQPANPPKGYDFVGWYLEVGYQTKVEKIEAGTTGKITLYAKYDLERFNIIYELNGGKLKGEYNKDFNKNESVILPTTPTKNGYEFKGWYTDIDCTAGNAITSIAKGTEKNVTVYAKWDYKVYNLEYVYGAFGEANPDNPTTYTIETKCELLDPINVTPGYEFIGWFINGAYTQEIETLDKTVDIEKLYAKYQPITYEIKYELAGGTNADTNPTEYTVENVGENVLTLADPVFPGCDFVGWFIGEEQVTTVPTIIGGVTITAKWTYTSYSIEYVLNQEGATNSEDNKTTYSRDNDFTLANPVKENVEFIGWYLEPQFITKVESTEALVGDVKLYAKWSPSLILNKNDLEIVNNGGYYCSYSSISLTEALTNGKTECADLYSGDAPNIDWYFNKHASTGTESLTITLNKETNISGLKIYAKTPDSKFEIKLYDANNNELLATEVTVNNISNTVEAVCIDTGAGIVYENVKTITITFKNLSKPFRVAEVVIETPNPAYEESSGELTPNE